MNEMQVFNYKSFQVRTVEINSEPWFVLKDVCAVLGISNHKMTAQRLDVDEVSQTYLTDSLGRKQETTIINESGLYHVILRSDKQEAKPFRKWVTSEVLPSIRKTGSYALPKDYPTALRALADAEEQKLRLLAENQQQAQVIADFEPIRQYVDTILESKGTMATSQIAADYGLTAQKLNKILHEGGVQRNVNGQWLLYAKYMGKGYTKSKTIQIIRSDGRPDSIMQTQWTQKGRLMIHEILTARGIEAVMDRRVKVCRE
jgi:prophage antirepressor-like protein|nr:MAG TPA: repressor domain protein [Caudoviricetes sp.]